MKAKRAHNDPTIRDRVLLQLDRFGEIPLERYNMPYGMSQAGIAYALGISRAHACIELQRNMEKSYIIKERAHVRQGKSVVIIYMLTAEGKRRVAEVKKDMKAKGIDLGALFQEMPQNKAAGHTPQLKQIKEHLEECLAIIEQVDQNGHFNDMIGVVDRLTEAQKLVYLECYQRTRH